MIESESQKLIWSSRRRAGKGRRTRRKEEEEEEKVVAENKVEKANEQPRDPA